jgi:hypothetical protein
MRYLSEIAKIIENEPAKCLHDKEKSRDDAWNHEL